MTGRVPCPVPGLAVAIVGHRSDRIQDAARVQQALAQLLKQAKNLVDSASGKPGLRLVSALAEGADRLAARAALAAMIPLEIVLPFPPTEYERDFATPDSRDEFRALLEQAGSVLILDGAPDQREKAYEAAGKALLDNCDLLIAVWDGGPGRGRGGTREVIEGAVQRRIPVVTISPDGTVIRFRPATGSLARLDDLPDAPIDELWPLLRRNVIVPFEIAAAEIPRAELPARKGLYASYPLLLRLLGAGTKRKTGKEGPTVAPPASDGAERCGLRRAFLWWDSTAVCAAQAFRSAVIVNFALAALAVVLATSSLLAGGAKWIFVVAEVVTILLLLSNTWYAGRARWQERWLESRELAEMLRVCLMLREVGIGRAVPDAHERGWTSAYALAMSRCTPLQSADLSNAAVAARPLIEEIVGQAAWNEGTAVRMHKAGHRLGRIGEILFVAVLLSASGWLLLALIAPETAFGLTHVLTAVTAGLPALATASYGIRLILDFEGVAERARRLARALRRLLAEWETRPPSAAGLQDFARGAADIMLGDVAAWRLLAEGRRLAIPG